MLLGGYTWDGANSYEFTAMPPAERVRARGRVRRADPSAISHGVRERHLGRLAPRRRSRSAAPATGRDDARKQHYDDLCQIDGRIVLAGEHASYIPAWQEGAILSSLDAIGRLHKRVLQG